VARVPGYTTEMYCVSCEKKLEESHYALEELKEVSQHNEELWTRDMSVLKENIRDLQNHETERTPQNKIHRTTSEELNVKLTGVPDYGKSLPKLEADQVVYFKYGKPKPYIFKELLKRRPDQLPTEEPVTERVLKAYAKSKLKPEKRRLKRLVKKRSVKKNPTSDTIQGITMKFQRPYEGPYVIQTVINPSLVELKDTLDKYQGLFNKKHLKSYQEVKKEANVKWEEVSANIRE
jgi:hypothetical protein